MDPYIGGGGRYQLSRELILHLNQKDISVIAHIVDQVNSTIYAQAWKFANQLNIPPHWHQIWNNYTSTLTHTSKLRRDRMKSCGALLKMEYIPQRLVTSG